MTEQELLEQMKQEWEQLKDAPAHPVHIPPLAAFALIAQLQLAFRHPSNHGWPRRQAEQIARELQTLFNPESAVAQVLERGWHQEFDGKFPAETTKQPSKISNKTEVHNCYTLYDIDEDGEEVEEKVLSFSRPQDWGDPDRWHYHYCRIELDQYVNHCHVWQGRKRNPVEAMRAIASSLFLIMIPGTPKELCDRSHLDQDDFWLPQWGETPPYYEGEEEQF